MPKYYDEISLNYWETHKQKRAKSKSYTCYHNGYVYGDDMKFDDIEYIYRSRDEEKTYHSSLQGPKPAYFAFVQAACAKHPETLKNFLTTSAEKYRIYTEEQVSQFSQTKRNSTRILDDSCKITVSGAPYYVANNLKICEYFNSAATNLIASERDRWYIRIYTNDDSLCGMTDRDETDESCTGNSTKEYIISVKPPVPTPSQTKKNKSNETAVKIDFSELTNLKKTIGNLGESIVLDYEKAKLNASGKADLASSIEHSSLTIGDGLVYDIQSFEEDGTPLYIEVKTTKQNKPADFYLSKKELHIANLLHSTGKHYRIYRIYNLNPNKGTGDLTIYEPPFDKEHYDMQAENWRINLPETP